MLGAIDTLVLCGGLGKRLRPQIGESQKVMAEVSGHPFLDILIGYLKAQGVKRVILCAGFKAETLEEYYQSKNPGLTIEFSKEQEPLGTGGAVKHAKHFVRSNPFFVLNGDSFCPIDLNEFLNFHKFKSALATIAVSKVQSASDFGSITLGSDQEIKNFEEKAQSLESFVNAGVYCFNRETFDRMPAEDKFSMEEDYFPTLIGKAFYGYTTTKEFIDIGTPERYKQAQIFLKG